MDFVNAALLWGLPLVAVPVIIHMLHRRRRDVIRWGAMQFLVEAAARRRRRWRLDDLLLMFLRVAAVAAVVVAMAQPRLRAGWFGPSGTRDIILVLDNSLSTQRTTSGRTVFSTLVARAEQVLANCRDGDQVRVLLASDPPEWLDPEPVSITADARRRLAARLREARPTLGSADMLRCLRQAIHAESPGRTAPRVITVLADGQAYGWRANAGGEWLALRRESQAFPAGLAVQVITADEPAGPAANLSLESLRPLRAVAGVGDHVSLSASIRNTGGRPAETSLVTLSEDTQQVGVAAVPPLAPGEATTVAFDHVFDRPGVYALAAAIDRLDDLPSDSAGRTVIEVVDDTPVLLVERKRDGGPLRNASDYLLAALGRAGAAAKTRYRSVFRPIVISPADLTPERIGRASCIILADVPVLSPEVMAALTAHIRGGGGLWILLEDETNRTFFNDVFFAAGQGLSPLALGEPVGDMGNRDAAEVVLPPAADHPATRLLADTHRLDTDRIRVYRRNTLYSPDARAGVTMLLAAGRGEPLAVEKAYGRGRVIVQALPLNPRWSSLPLCQAFVVMAHEWLWYLTEPGRARWNLQPGEPITARIADGGAGEYAEVRTPDGRTLKAASGVRDGMRTFTFTKTVWRGPYELTLPLQDGKPRTLPFVVQRDPKESDLTKLSDADRQALASSGGLHFGASPSLPVPPAATGARPEPVWAWVLVALLGVMAIEWFVAARLTRRRFAQSPGADLDANGPRRAATLRIQREVQHAK